MCGSPIIEGELKIASKNGTRFDSLLCLGVHRQQETERELKLKKNLEMLREKGEL